jgi:hypothetical protein
VRGRENARQCGHWLNGRLGAGTAADVIAAVLTDHGFPDFDVSGVGGDLAGFVQAEQGSARGLLEPLMAAFQIDAVETGGKLVFRSRLRSALPVAEIDVFAELPEEATFEETRGHASEFAGEAIVDHFGEAGGYPRVTARSRRMSGESERVLRLALPAVLHPAAAAIAAETALRDHRAAQRRLSFRLSPTDLAIVPGDVVRLADGPEGRFLVTQVTDGAVREIEARAVAAGEAPAPPAEAVSRNPVRGANGSDAFLPEIVFLDLPAHASGEVESFARVAAYSRPWRSMVVSRSPDVEGFEPRVRLDRPARIGRLAAPLGGGVSGRFDRSAGVLLDLPFGGLASADPVAILNGANRKAIRSEAGDWEVLAFLDAEEIAQHRWRLEGLLRGLAGTEDAMAAGHGVDEVAVVLDEAVRPLGLTAEEAGLVANWIVEAAGGGGGYAGPFAFAGGVRAKTPLAPVHLHARRLADGAIRMEWVRRARMNADSWLGNDIPLDEPFEAYRIDILSGAEVVRTVEPSGPEHVYSAADEIADFGAAQGEIAFRVRQKGLAVPLGIAAQVSIIL